MAYHIAIGSICPSYARPTPDSIFERHAIRTIQLNAVLLLLRQTRRNRQDNKALRHWLSSTSASSQ